MLPAVVTAHKLESARESEHMLRAFNRRHCPVQCCSEISGVALGQSTVTHEAKAAMQTTAQTRQHSKAFKVLLISIGMFCSLA